MNCFVKTTKDNFPNPNFYSAWKGWADMGCTVHTFEEEDLKGDSLWMSLNRGTPVFAGVSVFEEILNKLKVEYKHPGTYPEILMPYLQRRIKLTTLGEVRREFDAVENPIFVKPVKQKAFTGKVITNMVDLIGITSISDDCSVYSSEPINLISEFRVYVRNHEIQAVKHYTGDWSYVPQKSTVEEMVRAFKPVAPIAYGMDVGVMKNTITRDFLDVLIEVNDATSLGNYGMDCRKYADMLSARWFEICG